MPFVLQSHALFILDFGPRGRSPIEKDKLLNLDNLLRFALSGALCSSMVHLVLTPLDVVKTNLQTNPKKYPDPVSAFNTLLEENGVYGLYAGWVPTFLGFFVYGGISYAATEFFRRYYIDLFGGLISTEVPFILAAGVSILVCVYDWIQTFVTHLCCVSTRLHLGSLVPLSWHRQKELG